MESLLRMLCRWLYRLRVEGRDVFEVEGPVLLVPNHVSWLDWLFLAVSLEDDWKFVVSSQVAETSWIHRKIMKNHRTFPVEIGSPYGMKEIAGYLKKGGRLVLFAEGRLTTSGSLMKLYEGIGFLLQKSGATIITGYLRGVNRLPWVVHSGWTKWFPRVSLHGRHTGPMPQFEGMKAAEQRKKLASWLTQEMMKHRFEVEISEAPESVPQSVINSAREQPAKVIFKDATMTGLTYKKLVIGADLIGRELSQKLEKDEERVGILLPNINATPVSLLACWFNGTIPAMLNFTSGPAVMLQCAKLAGLKHIITARAFLEKAKIDVTPFVDAGIEIIYLDDIKPLITTSKKLSALFRFKLNSSTIIRGNAGRDDTAVVLFTSGSEGVPKGVELTHHNLLANIEQVLSVTDIMDDDRFFNPLPLFHSFGLTVGTVFPMVKGLFSFLYPNPLNYKAIPSAMYDLECTITMGTNTFFSQYGKAAHPMDFRKLRYVLAGAEKLQDHTFDMWNEKFGVRILQGYGATETSPCISVNTFMFHKKGTTGIPLPGQEVRIESVPGVEEGGKVMIRGCNVMKGYLNPEPNAAFKALDGWYDTGDIGLIDDDGYLKLLGRLKRFAKISGEMVSLTAVEDVINNYLKPQFPEDFQLAVVAVPDASKGEKIIAYANSHNLEPQHLRDAILKAGLNNLSIPREIRFIEEIPTLGTGKLDHKSLATIALESTPSESPTPTQA